MKIIAVVAGLLCLVAVYTNAVLGNPVAATLMAACVGINVHTYMRNRDDQ